MKVPASEQTPEQHPLRAAPLMPQAFRSVIRIIPAALLTLAHALLCVLVAGADEATSATPQPGTALLSAVTIGLGCPRTSLRCSRSEK